MKNSNYYGDGSYSVQEKAIPVPYLPTQNTMEAVES